MRRDEYVEYVLTEYGSLLKGVLIRNLYDKADRWEECFNDVLLAVWNNWSRFALIEEEKRAGWLCAIAKYKAIDLLRRESRCNEKVISIHDAWVVSEVERQYCQRQGIAPADNSAEELDKLLACLKLEDRDLFCRRYIKEESIEEISAGTGFSKENVYQRLSRGKRKLKEVWGKNNERQKV